MDDDNNDDEWSVEAGADGVVPQDCRSMFDAFDYFCFVDSFAYFLYYLHDDDTQIPEPTKT